MRCKIKKMPDGGKIPKQISDNTRVSTPIILPLADTPYGNLPNHQMREVSDEYIENLDKPLNRLRRNPEFNKWVEDVFFPSIELLGAVETLGAATPLLKKGVKKALKSTSNQSNKKAHSLNYSDILNLSEKEILDKTGMNKEDWVAFIQAKPDRYGKRLEELFNSNYNPTKQNIQDIHEGKIQLIDFYKSSDYNKRLQKGLGINEKEATQYQNSLINAVKNTEHRFTKSQNLGNIESSAMAYTKGVDEKGTKLGIDFSKKGLERQDLSYLSSHEHGHTSLYEQSNKNIFENLPTLDLDKNTSESWRKWASEGGGGVYDDMLKYYSNPDESRQRAISSLIYAKNNNLSIDDLVNIPYENIIENAGKSIPRDFADLRQFYDQAQLKSYLENIFSIGAAGTIFSNEINNTNEKYKNGGEMKARIKSLPKANNGLRVENDNYEMLSPDTLMIKGKKHKDGGTLIDFNGTTIEAEAGEPLSIDNEGNAVIWGNLTVPTTNKKFKDIAKEIAKEEAKYNKKLDKGIELVNSSNPYDGFEIFSFNSGKVLTDAALIKDREISQRKELLSQLQNGILETAEQTGKSPEKVVKSFEKGGTLKKYQEGGDLKNRYIQTLRRAAISNNLDPDIMVAMMAQESSFNPNAHSPKDAQGLMQFTVPTAEEYGLTEADLKSKDPSVQDKVIWAGVRYFKDLYRKNNNDYALALAAYNGGQGAVDFVKKETGKDNITGNDWLSFMQNRRETKPSKDPHAWQNETFNHINKVLGKPEGSVFAPSINYIGQNKLRPDFTNPSEELSNRPSFFPDPNRFEEDTQGVPRQPKPFENLDMSHLVNQDEDSIPNNDISRNYQVPEITPIRNRLGLQDFIGELAALTDRPDYVPGQSFEPQLYQPYQVSFQDRLNRNNSTFRAFSQQLTNNPEALSVLAAQKYDADNQVLAEEFRTNQAISNQVTNQNTELLNQAELQNLQLRDLQQQRQAQAKGITEDRKMQALSSISNKVNQNRALNNFLRMYENFSDFKMDESGNLVYTGPDPVSLISVEGQSLTSDPYQKTVVSRDAQGNVRNTREYNPSEMDKKQQFWNLFRQRRIR